MTPATSHVTRSDTVAIPTARIDAQEETFVLPIREYLETNGCQVFVNHYPVVTPSYHIAAGDADFVKRIFAPASTHGEKRLAIALSGTPGDISYLTGREVKVVLMDPVELTQDLVVEIFSFFFTNPEPALDKRKPKPDVSHQGLKQEIEEPQREAPREEPLPLITEEPEMPAIMSTPSYVPEEPKEETPVIFAPAGHEEVPHFPQAPALSEEDSTRVGKIIADVFGPAMYPKRPKRGRKKLNRSGWAGLLIMAGACLLPFVWYVLSLALSASALVYGATSLREGNIAGVKRTTTIARHWMYQGRALLGVASVPFSLIGLEETIRSQERTFSLIDNMVNAEEELTEMVTVGKEVATALLSNDSGNPAGVSPASALEKLRTLIRTLQDHLGLAQAELASLLVERRFPFSFAFINRQAEKAHQELIRLRVTTGYVEHFMSLYPGFAGFTEPKKYLVLLQNSMELRPTGGFIGSLAEAQFADGRLSDFVIQDVYTVDGQLKGHVDPPAPVRDLLAQEHWYLRDSNWDPDFLVSGTRASWFYEKETGTRVDGVIGISTPLVIDLLRATGPILLQDYNDRISSDNFFGKSLYYTQTNFFPGSTQKKDFLGTLAQALISRITSSDGVNSFAVFAAIAKALASHDIVFMFPDVELQAQVEHFGWAGRVPSRSGCTEGNRISSCLFDPLAVVEANVGINKVNYFVKRSQIRQVTIGAQGEVEEVLTLGYRNTSPPVSSNDTGAQPTGGGDYRMYTRFLLPVGASVSTITLDGTTLLVRDPKQKPPPQYVEKVDVSSGQFALGVALDIPPGTERRLVIAYTLGPRLSFEQGKGAYELFEQKQPGVYDASYQAVIRYPAYLQAVPEFLSTQRLFDFGKEVLPGGAPESGELVAKTGQLEYNTTLLRDEHVRINFLK